MIRLLLDLGNTRLKWAIAGAAGLAQRGAIALDAPEFDVQVVQAWCDLPEPSSAWLSAVAGEVSVARTTAALATRWRTVPVHRVTSPANAAGVRSAYDEPERLGVDRFLAMVGARARDSGAVLIAGCGTALAIDLMDSNGHHRGGLIAPAPALMRMAVLDRTGRVGWQRPGRVFAFGRSTEDGLESGCWHAAAALVERALAQATRELDAVPRLLLHGGDAERLAALLDAPARIAPDLVLEGLLRYAGTGGGPG